MNNTASPVSASAVSRILTDAGLTTSHNERRFRYDGIYVSKSPFGAATVYFDLATSFQRANCSQFAVEVLKAKGYECKMRTDEDGNTSLKVTRS